VESGDEDELHREAENHQSDEDRHIDGERVVIVEFLYLYYKKTIIDINKQYNKHGY